MRTGRAVIVAAGMLLFASQFAAAQAFTSLQAVPITAGAKTDDSQLNNRITNDMRVTIPVGQDWQGSEILISLLTGNVYNATNVYMGFAPVGTESTPNAALWSQTTARNGEFDTFVTSKNFQPATIAGRYTGEGPGTARGLSTNNATSVSVAWFNQIAAEDGTFTVGRFTLSNDASGTFVGSTASSFGGGVAVPFSGTILNGVMTVPEPGTAALLGLASVGLLARRRRA